MVSASKFARQMEIYGEVECGVDDSSLRKRIYPYVRSAISAMIDLVGENDVKVSTPRPHWLVSSGTSYAQKY